VKRRPKKVPESLQNTLPSPTTRYNPEHLRLRPALHIPAKSLGLRR